MDYSILKQQILDDIKTNSIARDSSKALSDMIKNDQATYKTAADYSKILGSVVSNSINNNIPDGIPDDELGAFADECLVPVYKKSQDTMLNACKNVQQIYNKQAGVGIKPAEVKRDESRTQNISKRFNEAEKFDDVSFLTNENVARSITRGAVNDSIRENSRMQSDAGLKIRISRTDGSGCCQWCAGLVGDYDSFEKLPADFWKIHRNCSCVIDYNVGKTSAKIKYKTDKKGDLYKDLDNISIIDSDNSKNDIVLTHFDSKDIKEAESYAKNVLGINANYEKFDLEVANTVNKELTELSNVFGDFVGAGYLKNVTINNVGIPYPAAYSYNKKTIFISTIDMAGMKEKAERNYAGHYWSTKEAEHMIRHEGAHAIYYMILENDPKKLDKISAIREKTAKECGIIEWDKSGTNEQMEAAGRYISYYALKNNKELVAESIAEYRAGNPRETAKQVVEVLLEGKI